MSRPRTKRSVKASADRLWSQLVKARAGYECERCGATPEAQKGFHSHHVYSRTNHRLRFEPRNGIAVDAACHRWAEEYPIEFTDWFRETRPQDAVWLAEQNRKGLIKRNLDAYLEVEEKLKKALEVEQNGI